MIQQQLNFSREAERESDRVGFQMLTDAGFDSAAWKGSSGACSRAAEFTKAPRRRICAPTR